MTPEEKWERLMKSIRRAALILGIEITERDVPEYLNWPIARQMSKRLWGRIKRSE